MNNYSLGIWHEASLLPVSITHVDWHVNSTPGHDSSCFEGVFPMLLGLSLPSADHDLVTLISTLSLPKFVLA